MSPAAVHSVAFSISGHGALRCLLEDFPQNVEKGLSSFFLKNAHAQALPMWVFHKMIDTWDDEWWT